MVKITTCCILVLGVTHVQKGVVMYLLALGLLFVVAKYLGWMPVAAWPWWWVLSPLGLAAVWWWVADMSGYTRQQAEKKMEQRKRDQLNKGRKRMGLPPLKD